MNGNFLTSHVDYADLSNVEQSQLLNSPPIPMSEFEALLVADTRFLR